jgi:cellulose synthase/poly-beta-1,6-N-acetylglucosamine synthase-like glycosyltransferase
MTAVAYVVLAFAVALTLYAYAGYAAALRLVAALRKRREALPQQTPSEWPLVSITVPVYNEAATIAATLERLLTVDYPADRRQILVVSDASNDGTDEIVRGFADRGVELLRVPVRGGKTAAENAALPYLRGEIIVNTDASVLVAPDSLRPLIAAFADASVGVASGRDVSVARLADSNTRGESGYVGYEMWVRDLETRVEGIVGASGCYYAIRADLHRTPVRADLSRDFSAPLIARAHGLRAVSVPDAVCFVPRTGSLQAEFRRKVRTMTRGMQTLRYNWRLLRPRESTPLFAWMLFSHKICRWLVPWAGALALAAIGVLSWSLAPARWILAGALGLFALAFLGWRYSENRRLSRLFTVPAYLVSGNLAAVVASIRALRGDRQPTWEPTRRDSVRAFPRPDAT